MIAVYRWFGEVRRSHIDQELAHKYHIGNNRLLPKSEALAVTETLEQADRLVRRITEIDAVYKQQQQEVNDECNARIASAKKHRDAAVEAILGE